MYHNRKVLSFIAAILYIIVLCSSGIIVAGQNDNPSATLPPRPVLDENHPVNTIKHNGCKAGHLGGYRWFGKNTVGI
jgi:hypothetical protein